ncbi:hypothetical protein HPP92_003346 [Vanilla planifolia]|uniref:Transcriptional regulator n=1 Tax=Vanilla planifolia TaxID=51239 RepID=A0A835VJT4_VANPL|nr:hypothetical protein HPP92_003346 [Vanilla planifolia]
MDVCAVNPKIRALSLSCRRARQTSQWRSFRLEEENTHRVVLEVRAAGKRLGRPLVVRATGRNGNSDKPSSSGNNDPSFPGGDGPQNGESKSDDSKIEPRIKLSDWRYFRATLVAREQANLPDSDAPTLERAGELSQKPNPKWAHPLPVPEAGCVLVATEKLDGVHSFERTVVLLHRLGTRGHRKGPSGVIINRPLHKKIKHMKPSNPMLDTTFADCPLHFGGPFDDTMFLLNTTSGASSLPGLEEVIPGICFGSLNCLDEAAALVNKGLLLARDFRFFIGYAGWDFEQLRYEIESNYWVVAACSSQVIVEAFAHSCSSMWEDILQLMGGQYSELSKKPKQDAS